MPFIHTIQINTDTKVGIWEISEPESYFLKYVSEQKAVKHPYKRLQHLAGRRLLKLLEPGFPTDGVQLNHCGKPYLPGTGLQFSISHSENYAAVIVSRSQRVGIDVEKIAPKLLRVAPKFMNEEELAFAGSDLIALALCWSAKEAVYKWYGNNDVTFRKHIHLKPFHAEKAGVIPCIFTKGERAALQLHYKVGREFVLVWLAGGD